MTMRSWSAISRLRHGERNLGAQRGAPSRSAVDPQGPVNDGYPVGEASQAKTMDGGRVEPAAIVPDFDGQAPVRLGQRDEYPAGPGVLDGVGQRLRDNEPGSGLDVLRIADAAQG